MTAAGELGDGVRSSSPLGPENPSWPVRVAKRVMYRTGLRYGGLRQWLGARPGRATLGNSSVLRRGGGFDKSILQIGLSSKQWELSRRWSKALIERGDALE